MADHITQIFLIVIVASLILDYPLQGEFLATYKQMSNVVLFIHSLIWGGGVAIVLMYFGLFTWYKLAFLVFGHMIVDGWKCRLHYKKIGLSDFQSYYVDQFAHLLQLIYVVLF